MKMCDLDNAQKLIKLFSQPREVRRIKDKLDYPLKIFMKSNNIEQLLLKNIKLCAQRFSNIA